MNTDFITQRHEQLWSEKNKQMQRIVAATLIFAIVALLKVLQPYKNNYVQKSEIMAQIDSLNVASAQSDSILQEINKLDQTIIDVDSIIENKPWDQKRIALMQAYSRLNQNGRATSEDYQNKADSTVQDISTMVLQNVYEPLTLFLRHDSLANALMPKTTSYLKDLPELLTGWVNTNLGRNWYNTISMKEATVNRLTTSLDEHLASLSENLRDEKRAVVEYQLQLQREIINLEKQKKVEQKIERLEEIEMQMAEILPSWLRGLVSVRQLVEYFPLIMAILFVYTLHLGFSLSRHYFLFSASDPATYRGNALLASIWTITDRGRATILTFLMYLGLAIVLWLFFERGVTILNYCLNVDESFNPGLEDYMYLAWFVRLVMLAMLLYVFVHFRKFIRSVG